MQLELLYHGNCFDGCASAALFGRWFQEREGARLAGVRYRPVQHQQGDAFPADAFGADVNACVDFRYSPRLDWWFDHHASAFPTPADRASFERDATGQKFWDPAAPSCTGFIARTLANRFGWRAAELDELVRWADVIDAARFESAAVAVRLEAPALRIMTLLEATKDPALPTRLIGAMQRLPLAEIAAQDWVTGPLAPILERHRGAIDVVRRQARVRDGVVEIDLGDTGLEAANKFIAYDLFPEARYTVVVSKDPKRTKVSVGSNPWAREQRTHDISKLCERYGGGGHPVVGAVSLAPDRLADARRIAAEIASALRGEPNAP
ncbi:phosphoesterase DHHA1 [Anaeromyxobacter sp. K]|uniref:DHH family phosphoesterase n=1 Tax=Anaeromyxobacter sp. (strain K) TaxID=447217 RepID=UPI00015F9CF5|nr:DHH family phosphoesterase [Anaeromyxobacter sp. K]ACG71395.1 phosphoesterase DHHA1 [Anaeromyxobacter sp. K]